MSAPSAGSATPPTGGLTRNIIQKVIYGAVVLVALFILLVAALVHHFTFDACANIAGRQKTVPFGFHLEGDDGDRCVVNPPLLPSNNAPAEQRPWSFQTPEIPAEGLPIYLYQGWKDWPKGGAITITTPSGEVLHDQPGAKVDFGFQPDGMYTFRADPIGSKRQVQLYNRW